MHCSNGKLQYLVPSSALHNFQIMFAVIDDAWFPVKSNTSGMKTYTKSAKNMITYKLLSFSYNK